MVDVTAIPNRSVFRAAEVCELAAIQPFILRSWEAEFPDLGVVKGNGPRVYRRADVEKVMRLKQLILVDGLTLAGARRRLTEEGVVAAPPPEEEVSDADVVAMMDQAARSSLKDIKRGLEWILDVVGGEKPAPFALAAPTPAAKKPAVAKAAPAAESKAAKTKKKARR